MIISDDIILNKYSELNTIDKVARYFNISYKTVYKKLRQYNVLNKRIYTCKHDFFSQDTPEAFYWAGFIAADGCVRLIKNKYKRLQVSLSSKDYKHLELFKIAIGFSGPIKEYKGSTNNYNMIRISSNKIFDDLSKFNIAPRKTFTYSFPKWIFEHHLVNHFMRGYFDGDGCFYNENRNNSSSLVFVLTGTLNFLTIYRNILRENCYLYQSNNIYKIKNIYQLKYKGNIISPKIRDFLYKNSKANIRLERKFNIAYSY